MKIQTDELVKKLLENIQNPIDITMLYGFVLVDEKKDDLTLYFDAELKTSIVVKKEDILHFIRLTKTHSAIGGTIIWIKNITIYQQDKSFVSQKNAQQLFNGDIYNEYVSSIKDKQTTSHSKNTHTPGCSCEH